MNKYLFVYGTLKPESGMFKDLGIDYDVVGEGFVEGVKLQGTEYPAVIPPTKNRKDKIKGIIIKLNEPRDALQILDEYEEYFPSQLRDSLYLRRKTNIKFINGPSEEGWIYWFNDKKGNKANRRIKVYSKLKSFSTKSKRVIKTKR